MQFFLRHIELFLSAAGLLVIVAVPGLAPNLFGSQWVTAAVTATFVGVLHGMIFWLVRSRQRKLREQTISEISSMLRDVVNNQLTIIAMASESDAAARAKTTVDSARNISTLVNSLNEEKLRQWRERFPNLPVAESVGR